MKPRKIFKNEAIFLAWYNYHYQYHPKENAESRKQCDEWRDVVVNCIRKNGRAVFNVGEQYGAPMYVEPAPNQPEKIISMDKYKYTFKEKEDTDIIVRDPAHTTWVERALIVISWCLLVCAILIFTIEKSGLWKKIL